VIISTNSTIYQGSQVHLWKIWQTPAKIWHLYGKSPSEIWHLYGIRFFHEKQYKKMCIFLSNIFHCFLRLGVNHFERENSRNWTCISMGINFDKDK
jgi:hypothetical protein